MTKRSLTPILLVCAAVGVACGSDGGFEPKRPPEPERPPVFTTVEVRPAVAHLSTVAPGSSIQLSIVMWDQRGARMPGAGPATYSSSAPAVAGVSSSGVVTAAAPGIAVITAALTLGGITRTASMIATVSGHDEAPGEHPEIAGVYDLTAPITSFDPAWGDLTGYRYTAVLTLQQYNRDTFEGTYADLQVIGPGGESSDGKYTGFVGGSLDLDGRVVIELVGGNHTWTTWSGQGKLASGFIDGTFGCCGHIGGTFTAERRQAE
jgi:hypothetical protein